MRLHNPVGLDVGGAKGDENEVGHDLHDEDADPRCILMCCVPPVKGTFSVGAQTVLMVHTLHHP